MLIGTSGSRYSLPVWCVHTSTQWLLRASDDNIAWTTIDTVDIHSSHNWQLQEHAWGVGGSTPTDTRSGKYRYWRLQFTRTNGGGKRLHEISFFSCGNDLTPSLVVTTPDAPESLVVQKSDILSFEATVNDVGGSSPTVSVTALAGKTSWAYSDKWSCTASTPAWYWNLPDFAKIEDNADWSSMVADSDMILTLNPKGQNLARGCRHKFWSENMVPCLLGRFARYFDTVGLKQQCESQNRATFSWVVRFILEEVRTVVQIVSARINKGCRVAS